MTLGTPRSEQSQTVIRSYGWSDGCLYRQTVDRSHGTETWHVADEKSAARLLDYDGGAAYRPPNVAEWTPCAEPEAQ